MRLLTKIFTKHLPLESSKNMRPDELDINFYKNYYTDLSNFDDEGRLIEHYILHGRIEGRYPNATTLYQSIFDAEFYRSYYTDMAAESRDEELLAHYINHGRAEGRIANEDLLVEYLENKFGKLPDDFVPAYYKMNNNDLVGKVRRWELIEHYIHFGKKENRKYQLDLTDYEQKYAHFLNDAAKRQRPESLRIDKGTFAEVLAESGIHPGVWLNKFMLYEFCILNARWLPSLGIGKMEGLLLFLTSGISRLSPIAVGEEFDPEFYKTRISSKNGATSAVDLYRDWLNRGCNLGIGPNENNALRSFIGLDTFPQCFDYEKYRNRMVNSGVDIRPGRFNTLEHFVKHGFSSNADCLIGCADRAVFVISIGEYHINKSNYNVALKAFDKVIAIDPQLASAFHRRGDTLMAIGREEEATASYIIAADAGSSSVWSHIHAAEGLSLQSKTASRAMERIQRASPRWSKSPHFREAGHRVIANYFSNLTQSALGLYSKGQRKDADILVEDGLNYIKSTIEILEPLPANIGESCNTKILLLANRDLPQCDHYRVEQRLIQLEAGGWDVEVFRYQDAHRCRQAIDRASAVIIYRAAALPAVMHAIIYASALGVPTFYDIDDLIFDHVHYPDPFDTFEGQISAEEYAGLQFGVPLIRFCIALCDAGIASTPALAEFVQPLVKQKTCYVVRNAFDLRNERYLSLEYKPFSGELVTIFYGSGTKAHNKDFNDLVGPALTKIMHEHKNVRLVIAGYLTLHSDFKKFSDRVLQLGFDPDVNLYWEVLSGADINISVLSRRVTTDAKSEIKWLEAAMFGIPSIVSKTRTFEEIITDKMDGYFAETCEDWIEVLDTLVRDEGLRRRIGREAKAKAVKHYNMKQSIDTISRFLPVQPKIPTVFSQTEVDHYQIINSQKKIKSRILLVNVYFPPHTIGGATRVMRDNIDFFIENHSDEYDIAIVSSDDQVGDPYKTRVDSYRGVPVYRISSLIEPNMDWRPFNDNMREPFLGVVDRFRPDLIHFHCIQRLTATLAQVAVDKKIPYIVTVHDAWWISDLQFLIDQDGIVHIPTSDPLEKANTNHMGYIKSIARRRMLGRILDQSEFIVAVSKTFAEIYQKAGHTKTISIPNGVSQLQNKSCVRSQNGKVRMGQIGGRTTHKGATLIEVVLKANKFENLELTMVDHGFGGECDREEVWGATPTKLIGFVPQERVVDLYASFDVLLAPSLWPESFGLVTREAQSLGIWVVASELGAISEDVVHGVNGFKIDVSSPAGLTDVLHLINADPTRFLSPPPQAHNRIRTVAEQGSDLDDLYKVLLH